MNNISIKDDRKNSKISHSLKHSKNDQIIKKNNNFQINTKDEDNSVYNIPKKSKHRMNKVYHRARKISEKSFFDYFTNLK